MWFMCQPVETACPGLEDAQFGVTSSMEGKQKVVSFMTTAQV